MEVLKSRPIIGVLLKNFRKTLAEKTEETPKEIRWKPEELAQELERLVQEGERIKERKTRRNGGSNGSERGRTATAT